MPAGRAAPGPGWDDGVGRLGESGVSDVDDLRLVDGPRQSPAEVHVTQNGVAERLLLVAVERQVVVGRCGEADGGETLGGLQRFELRRRDVVGGVDDALLQFLHHRIGVLVAEEEDLVDLGTAAPVAGVGDHLHVAAFVPLHGLERPRADNGRRVLVRGAGFLWAHVLPDVLRQNRYPEPEHVCLRRVALELQRVIVESNGLDDVLGEA